MLSDPRISRLYGLYIHNLTNGKSDNRQLALETVNIFLQEVPPMRYEYGDVLVLMPEMYNDDDELDDMSMISAYMEQICSSNGLIVDRIHPNQLYRLNDSFVVHYIFTDGFVEQQVTEKHVYDWERSMGLTQADMRYTRYIKTFFT